MPAPTFVSSSPTNGQTAVKKNASISLTFDVALNPSTVGGDTVVLFNSMLNQRVDAEVGLGGAGKVITITPAGHLFPDTGYRIRIVGVDVSPTCVKSTGGNSLALTITSVFQTGDTLETGSLPASAEGDLELPDVSLFGGGGGPLRLVSTDPEHLSFGISPSISQIAFKFNALIDPGTVTGNVDVKQTAFYDEEGFLARETNIGSGVQHYFGSETGYYFPNSPSGFLDPLLFRDRAYDLVTIDDTISVRFEDGYTFPNNVAIEITLRSNLADKDGNTLGGDLPWFACVKSYPNWASILAVRHQAGFNASAIYPDTYIGLRTWMSTIDLLGEFNWALPTDRPSRYAMEYVRTKAALEIWNSLIEDKGINAGTSKKLGDFEVVINTAAGSARPSRMRVLEERLEELDRYLWGGLTQTPRVGIRSILDPYEPGRGYFRDRLWRDEVAKRWVGWNLPSANTAAERAQPSFENSFLYGGVNQPGGPGNRHHL